MRKIKYKKKEEDWGERMQEMEALDEKEKAVGRSLDSSLREATVCTKGLKKQRIKIWTWLEIAALWVVKARPTEQAPMRQEHNPMEAKHAPMDPKMK